jgi:hypothetical protein
MTQVLCDRLAVWLVSSFLASKQWTPLADGTLYAAMSPVLETGERKTLWSFGGNWTLLYNKIVEITVSQTGSG